MRSVISAVIACRQCRCRAIYSGPLDVNGVGECDECGHRLVGDHPLTVNGVVDPTAQFRRAAITPPSQDRGSMSERV
jgi:hypothetical protein